MIENHQSFAPAEATIARWDDEAATLTAPEIGRQRIADVRKLISRPVRADMKRLTAQSWGATPGELRRAVLRKAGLNPDRWESPIHSFTDSERAALRAAALAAVRAFERVLNAI